MTVNGLIKELQLIKKELREIDVQVQMRNGLLCSPEIKVLLKDRYDVLNTSVENVECILIKG